MITEPMEGADLEFADSLASIMGTSDLRKVGSAPAGTPAEGTKVSEVGMEKKASGDMWDDMFGMPLQDLMKNADFRRGVEEGLEERRTEWEPLLVSYWGRLTGQL